MLNNKTLNTGAATFAAIIATATAVNAAEPAASTAAVPSLMSGSAYQPKWTVGAELGLTTGAGGSLEYRISDHWSAIGSISGGAGSGNMSFDTYIGGVNFPVTYNNMDVTLLNETLGVKWYPSRHSNFFVNCGILLNQSEFKGYVDNTGNAGQFLGVTPASAFGSLSTTVTPSPVSPYLTVGYGFFLDQAHQWKLGGEVGAYFTQWDVTASRDGFPAAPLDDVLALHRQAVSDKFNENQVIPIVKLGISFSF